MSNFLKDAWSRFHADTPKHFKKIIGGAISVGVMGTGIKGMVAAHMMLPALLVHYYPHMISTGVIAGLVAGQACVSAPGATPTAPPPDPLPDPSKN